MGDSKADLKLSPAAKKAQSVILKVVVFLAGAVLMAFEIVGSRILAPRFGNDIFVWGSLIGIFLAALSMGYFLGGIAADKWPRHEMLGGLLGLAGLLLIITPSFAGKVAVEISRANLGARGGPLVASIVLFAVPSILIGMVSPWAIRLETKAVARSGRVAGVLYAISTLGSIFGTFITAFVLIGLFKVTNIVRLLGGVLIIAAFVQIISGRVLRASVAAGILAVLGAGAWFMSDSVSLDLYDSDVLLLEEDSTYNHIAVVMRKPGYRFDDFNIFGYKRSKRYYLVFDNYWESAIYDLPERNYPSACRYTDLLHFPFLCVDEPKRIKSVCVIGGGGGVVPRQYLTEYAWVEKVDLVEIDPRVVEIARQYFHLDEYPGYDPKNPKLVTHVMDGREYFRRNPDSRYDLIVLDAFGLGGRIPFHLLTLEYLEEIKTHLNPGGTVAVNIISSLEGSRNRFYHAVMKTMETAFPGRLYVFPRYYYADWWSDIDFDRSKVMNIILVAVTSGKLRSPRVLAARLDERKNEGWLSSTYRLGYHLKQYLPPETRAIPEFTTILTDEFAPVETLRY